MVTLKSLLKNCKGVVFHSPKGNSGYAEAGKRVIHQLLKYEIPTSWHQFISDDTKNDETDFIYQTVKKTINKNIEFDTAIFNCTPEQWFEHIEKFKIKFINKKLIGYTTWETNKIPDLWIGYCNLMNELWVPSKFNKEIFERCGVNIPIKVVPYPFIEQTLPEINSDSLTTLLQKSKWYGNDSNLFRYGSDWKIFYTIGEWNDRKNMEDTVKTFCKTFTSEDRVKLIIKTFHLDYSKKNVLYCNDRLEEILKSFPSHPEILLITSNLSNQDVLLLHSIGDCFYSMTRGEGYCIGALDAHNYGNDVIIPNFGGHVDYLGDKYKGFVGYDLVEVSFKERESIYSGDQKWADPNIHDGMDRLKEVYLKFDSDVEKTPITLKKGWYFKETKNGKFYRQSATNSTVLINIQHYDCARFKIKYEYGEPTKEFDVTIDSSIRKKILLKKGIVQDVLIPIVNVKKIDFCIEGFIPNKQNNSLWDHRNVGFIFEGVDLIRGSDVDSFSVEDLNIENELTDFYFLDEDKKLSEDLKNEISLFETNKNYQINLAKLEVKSDSEFKGITYIGQYGTSGYATAAKGNLCYFFTKGIPISWIPLYFDNSVLSDECFYNAMVKSLVKKPLTSYDTVFIHATPDIWPELCEHNKLLMTGKKKIGYTVWETSKLPYSWVENINECVDEVWCPSTYNENVFKNSGVKIPIRVFPHIFLQKELPVRNSVDIQLFDKKISANESEYYTFYNISELNPRKGVEDLIKTYCEAFTNKDKVRLILKVHYKNYEEQNKKYCIKVLNDIVCSYKKPPKIYYILNNLSEKEILGLHSIGDCYVSLCKSEGFGLTIFEAFKYGKRVITTGYGGQVDFLGKDYEGLVQYKIGPVKGMKEFSKYYTEDQQWAFPVLDHARDLMVLATK